MVKNPPENTPRLMPYLFYTDLEAAVKWLANTFGFEPGFKMPGPEGGLMHAEISYKDANIMMGPPNAEMNSKSPKELTGIHQSLYIYVDDVDAHYRRAKEAGAPNITEPMEMFWGDRMYTASDPEGHQWSFAQHVRDVAPEDFDPQF